MLEKLFVYGTLGLGRPNEHILTKIGGVFESASIRGTLIEEGWGAEMGYPALVLDSDGDKIEGFIFTSVNLPNHWSYLDDFEGEAYQRVIAEVITEKKLITSAYVYTLQK